MLRKHFYLILSALFWLMMIVGFADNWLYDVHQPSNSVPKFIVHGLFAFAWFTIFLVQAALVRTRNVRLHQRLGIAGLVIFVGMALSTGYLYLSFFLEKGYLRPISKMISSQLVFAVVLVALGYLHRKNNLAQHKTNMLLANLWLIQPGMDRWVDHIFPSIFLELWLAVYLLLFAAIMWYYKRVPWQLWVGALIWLAGLVNAMASGDF
ncbi:MAG: hypothetical protein WBP58_11295 [Chitinophagaceae bacterium]